MAENEHFTGNEHYVGSQIIELMRKREPPYRQLYTQIDSTTTRLERIPVSYYDNEVLFTRKPKRDSYTTGFVDGKKVLLNRFRREPYHLQEVQTRDIGNVFFKANSVEKIVSNTPLTEKIVLKGGEIEFGISGGNRYIQLSRYRKDQAPEVLYSASRKLGEGVSPEEAFRNAKAGISNLLLAREFKKRAQETRLGIANYQSRLENARKRKFGQVFGDLGDISPEIMKAALSMESQSQRKRPEHVKAPSMDISSVPSVLFEDASGFY